MAQLTPLICLLLVRCAAPTHQIHANCKDNVSLPCPVVNQEDMDFLALVWYKVSISIIGRRVSLDLIAEKKTVSPYQQGETDVKRNGIIRKSDDGVRNFGYERNASFGKLYSLLLPGVTESDSGTYWCDMSANVGGQNKKDKVELIVSVCRTEVQLTTMNVVTLRPNQTSQVCNEVHLTQTWSFLGFGAVAAVKILLSIITIKVIRSKCLRRRRSEQFK